MLWTQVAVTQWRAKEGDYLLTVERLLVEGPEQYRWRVYHGSYCLERGIASTLQAARADAVQSMMEYQQDAPGPEEESIEELGVGSYDYIGTPL